MLLLGLRTEDGSDPAEKRVRIDGAEPDGGLLIGRTRSRGKAQMWALYPRGVKGTVSVDVDVRRIELPRRPLPSGARSRVKPEYVEGPWRFSFDLSSAGGTRWTGKASDRTAGVTVTLDEVTVSPTIVIGHLTFGGDLPEVADDDWIALVSVSRGERSVGSSGGSSAGPGYTFFGDGGFSDTSRPVIVRVEEIVADTVGGGQERIKGPWIIEVPMAGR
jgi:hypothetical protein